MRPSAGGPRRLLVLALLAVLLTACGSTPAPSSDALRVRNCGRTVVFEQPPRRVVSLNQHATEILLAMGIGERLVGTAFPDDRTPPESVAEEYAQVPVLASKYPSMERILAARPDLVVGGYASAFSRAEGRGRQAMQARGIDTLLLSAACSSGPTGLRTLLDDIAMLGKVLGLTEGAQALANDIANRVRAVERRLAASGAEPVEVFVYDSGRKSPFTLGGHGIGTDVLRRAGARNVFADVPGRFVHVSWEQVAARAPEAIVLVDYLGSDSVSAKRAFLEGHPLASRTPAVRHDRYVTLQLVQLIEGIRFPAAVEKLARELHGV